MVRSQAGGTTTDSKCNFRFPGQYEDEETGLCYNRFRYYMPSEGMYTQRDPIGLAGGNPTVYGYTWNSLLEIDPLGLEIVYRNIRFDEDINIGLVARNPTRGMSAAGHVRNGSKDNFKGSQFISTTIDINVANQYRKPGQMTVMFDTDAVLPSSTGVRNIIDVSTSENAQAAGLSGPSGNYAVSSREILVEGTVPPDAITIVNRGCI